MVELTIGRDAELEAIERFLDQVPVGRSALFIEGTPGIGKSTLWREGLSRAATRGYRVLTTRPAEAEAKLSYSGLADLIGGLDRALFEALPETQGAALAVALARAPGKAERRTLFAGLVSLLGSLAATEREIAVLAAAGRTNRDIAGALFMSPKTVEKRLASVYDKLGIRTRAELGGRMAQPIEGPGTVKT